MHLNANGAGEGPPTSREVALQIDKKLRESDRPPVRGSKKRSGDHYDRSSKRHHPSSLPCREVTSEENGFPFTNRE